MKIVVLGCTLEEKNCHFFSKILFPKLMKIDGI